MKLPNPDGPDVVRSSRMDVIKYAVSYAEWLIQRNGGQGELWRLILNDRSAKPDVLWDTTGLSVNGSRFLPRKPERRVRFVVWKLHNKELGRVEIPHWDTPMGNDCVRRIEVGR